VNQGCLSSAPGSRERFLDRLAKARTPSQDIRFEPRSHIWTSSLRSVERRLGKLFKHNQANQVDIHNTLEQALFFVRQDPLYLPYLFNETLDLAGLAKTRHSYEPRDMMEFKRIGKNILAKVREVDRCVAGLGSHRAA